MRYVLPAFLLFVVLIQGIGGEPPSDADRAKAALALAKAKARCCAKTTAKGQRACFESVEDCRSAAKREGKLYVIWVGLQCCDYPEVRETLGDRLHCHTAELHGDRTPRLLLNGHDGEVYRVPQKNLTPEYVRTIITPPMKVSLGREQYPEVRRGDGWIVGTPAQALPVCRT